MIKVLLACSDQSYGSWRRHPNVGRLLTPVLRTNHLLDSYTAMDNCAYSNWNPKRFGHTLLTFSSRATSFKWVAVPDVVGDAQETLKRFEKWHKTISGLGYPLAFVAQDGLIQEQVPWERISCIFIGGTDDYKLSQEAYNLCKQAKVLRKLVHIGRVNSLERIKRFEDVMDSFDGLSFSKYSRSNLPRVLRYLESLNIEKSS